MIDIKKQINTGAVENITFTFPEGTSHQAGSSYMQGNLVVVNECLKITQNFSAGDEILTLPFNVKWAYGYIQQTASGAVTTSAVHCIDKQIKADSNIDTSKGLYPKIIITTWKA